MNLETEIDRGLWAAIRRSYESSAWSNAILDAIYYVSDAIRAKTGLQSDGTALAGQAFGGKSPKLRLNRLETDSETSVQQGVEHLFRGLYQAYRNPRSHDRVDDTQADADAIIIFVSHLLRLIGHARAEFSLDACVQRVLEENFVPNARYAEILVTEIPTRHRLDVFLSVYQSKLATDGTKLRYFFDVLLPKLSESEQTDALAAISEELRETKDDDVIRTVLQALNPNSWSRVDEAARLRVENRLICNMQDGRYSSESGRCSAGALATWGRSFFAYFTLKHEAYRALTDKLQSNSHEAQDYVFKFFFSSLDKLAEKPHWPLEQAMKQGLSSGDRRFYDAYASSWLWKDELWSDELKKAIETYRASDPMLEDEDEVPF